MIELNNVFANSLDREPVHVSLRDKEFAMIIYDLKPPMKSSVIDKAIEMGASLFAVTLVAVTDFYGNNHYTVHGVTIDDLLTNKLYWVRFSEHFKSQLIGYLGKAHESGKIKLDEWVYVLVGKSHHYVFINKEYAKDDKTD